MRWWAHSACVGTPPDPSFPFEGWQSVDEHDENVERLAGTFGDAFGARNLAAAAGRLHDRGKRDPIWQAHLVRIAALRPGTARPKAPVDHRLAGAYIAAKAEAVPLAQVILGHHGGLPSRSLGERANAELARLLKDPTNGGPAALRSALEGIEIEEFAGLRDDFPSFTRDRPHSLEMFLRFVASALVDADHLDTARHFSGAASPRVGPALDPERLFASLERYRSRLPRGEHPVAAAREQVFQASLRAAELPQGVFRLEAPTGSGKTLAAMAFALRHAARHGLRRVIVAVPFLSITEQTASVYRAALGMNESSQSLLLEHHSALERRDDPTETESSSDAHASENWDAPVIVTTTVQLFESLLANGPRRIRKLHNIARSVVIVDEAQALPAGLMDPIEDVISELARHYGVTFLLTTATQPTPTTSRGRAGFPSEIVREVLGESSGLFHTLARTEFEFPPEPFGWSKLAVAIAESPQALAIVNTRRQAVELVDALGGDAMHLSTYLYGEHRRSVLGQVRARLDAGEPCVLVSTQVVEAGVDLDFPVVYRAMGPLDAIVQAAGRCNREGRLGRNGRVVVFEPEDAALPAGSYSTATAVARLVLQSNPDLHDPRTFARYFAELRKSVDADARGIQKLREAFDFPTVARASRFIDETESVVVIRAGHADGPKALTRLREAADRPSVAGRRALQPYVVSLRRRELETSAERGLANEEEGGMWTWMGSYDERVGIGRMAPEAGALILG